MSLCDVPIHEESSIQPKFLKGPPGVSVRPLGVTTCPPPTWRYGPRKSML